MDKYWRVYKEDLELASDFKYLSATAISALYDMDKDKNGRDIVQICGPTTEGGLGNKEANITRLKHAIEFAQKKGLFVFNQLHLQEAINRIVEKTKGERDAKVCSIFVVGELYYPIFITRRINRALFLPGWEKSTGAYWENRILKYLNTKVEDYPKEWLALL
jgi:hypothetical protein